MILCGLCSDIGNGQVAAVPIENPLSLLAQPHASKLLRRLRSHSLRSEAALKDFFGYMPHLSLFMSEQIQQNNTTSTNEYEALATNPTLRASLKRGSGEADETCYCQLLCKAACYYEQSCLHCTFIQRLAVASFVSHFAPPISGLFVKLYGALW